MDTHAKRLMSSTMCSGHWLLAASPLAGTGLELDKGDKIYNITMSPLCIILFKKNEKCAECIFLSFKK